MRSWVAFSSSSGETLKELWVRLADDTRLQCQGIYTDRACGSLDIARTLLPSDKVFESIKADFEKNFLASAKKLNSNTLILLVGFFGILSDSFIKECPFPIVNTHPSLLPAFTGLDKRVHQKAFENVCVSGFTVHMVSEVVDAGTVLFQHPVWIDPNSDWEQMRQNVRKREQSILPRVWEQILKSDLRIEDLKASSSSVRKRLGLNKAFFEDSRGII